MKIKGYGAFFCALCANFLLGDMFSPLVSPNTPTRFILETYIPTPCRVQYRGSMMLPEGEKYVFCVDETHLVYLRCGQRSPEGFALDQVQGGCAIIREEAEDLTLPLRLGQTTYLPHRFRGTLYDTQEETRYEISDQCRDLSEALTLKFAADEAWYVFEKGPLSHCHAYKIGLKEEQDCFKGQK